MTTKVMLRKCSVADGSPSKLLEDAFPLATVAAAGM